MRGRGKLGFGPLRRARRPTQSLPRWTKLWEDVSPSTLNGIAILTGILASALPTTAGWGKGSLSRQSSLKTAAPIGSSRPAKNDTSSALSLNSTSAFPLPTPSPAPVTHVKEKKTKASSVGMSRGKSSDSAQSGIGTGTTNSTQASPKKRPTPLTTNGIMNKITPIPLPTSSTTAPPPGLSRRVDDSAKLNGEAGTQIPEDLLDGSVSAESEAGPSSGSPAPQTPSRSSEDMPPPPLTSDPICLHSPYEEPRIYPFPSSDPAFEFVLSPDAQREAQDEDYQPSPFSKTILSLAQLGILAPEVLEPLPIVPPPERNGTPGLFSPFDADSETIPDALDRSPGNRGEDVEERRTTSRFDFARPSSRPTISREQSPFALRKAEERDMWGQSNFAAGTGFQSDSRRPSLVNGNGFTSYNGDNAWAQAGRAFNGSSSASLLQQPPRPDSRQPANHHHPREEYGNGPNANATLSMSQQQRKYGGDASMGHYGDHGRSNGPDDGMYVPQHGMSPMAHHHQQQHQHHIQQSRQQTHSPLHHYGPQDARMLGQYAQQRAQSPTPLSHGRSSLPNYASVKADIPPAGYRRF